MLKEGRAENIFLANAYCDLVTCQTLLIHVESIEQVLREFARILKKKGKVILAEPNNLVNSVMFDPVEEAKGFDYFRLKIEFELGYAIGKHKLQEGKSYSVESIPPILQKLGFTNIQIHLSDKVFYGFANDYEKEFEEIKKADFEKSKRYLAASGTGPEIHAKYWESQEAYFREKAILAKKDDLFDGKASLMYLISADKP